MWTRDGKKIEVAKLSWNEALFSIKAVNPELSNVLKQIDLNGEEFYFYKAQYDFGDVIIQDKNTFFSLEGGGCISLNDKNLPNDLYQDLAYDTDLENPLGIILNKSLEPYTIKDGNVNGATILKQGSIFGIPKALDSNNPDRSSILYFNLNAGSRSLFMLPKISDKVLYTKVCKNLNINLSIPESTAEHWQTFIEISEQLKSDWKCEILFFSRKLVNYLKRLPELELFLYKTHASSYTAWHSIASIWNKDLEFINNKRLLAKYNHNLFNIIKYIVMLAANSEVGFVPMMTDEMAPISLIQRFFKNDYGVNNPIIMGPSKFNYYDDNQLPVYVSLNQQSNLLDIISSSGKYTNMTALLDIIYLYRNFKNIILSDAYFINSSLKSVINMISLEYYHNNSSAITDIKSSLDIIGEDERFGALGQDFPVRSIFFNGCVKLSKA